MEDKLVFEEVYKINMTCLRLNLSHPSVPRDLKWLLTFILMQGLYTAFNAICLYNLIFINVKENDFPNACSNGVYMVIYFVVTFKYGVMVWYQKDIKDVIRYQQEYFDSFREYTVEEQAVVKDYIQRGQWVSKLWLRSTIVTAGMFPVKSFIDSAYSAYAGDFRLHSFNENSYGPYIDEIKGRVDVFILMYAIFSVYTTYTAIMYSGFAPFGPLCILNACAQMDIVMMRVNHLFDEGFDKEKSPKQLQNLVKFTQNIYGFVDQINDIFQVLYEMCLKASAILIPISLYLIIEGFSEGKLYYDYVMFSYMASLLCFVPCYYSDYLKEKGDDLRCAIYASGWEKFYDRNTRVTLRIMLIRATRSLSIKTVFRAVCLEAFSDLCKEAYVIFNMMYAVLH
uniref:Odorant receptor n=1 Tax=Epiphyas postvittana TaxID=65032 RepID=A0A0K8TU70_EPIPO